MLTSLLIMLLLIFLSAIAVASEASFVSISDAKVEEDAENGHKRAIRVKRFLDQPKSYQTALQIVTVLSPIINGAIALNAFSQDVLGWFNSDLWFVEALVVIVIAILLLIFHMVFGVLIPRRLAHKYPDTFAYRLVYVAVGFMTMFAPLIWIMNMLSVVIGRIFGLKAHEGDRTVTEEEIRTIVEESSQQGAIDEEESEMIQNIFDFSDTTVDEIMTHRTEISALNVKSNKSQLIEFVQTEQYTRYPVYEGGIDHIIGTIHVKDLLKYLDKPEEKFSLRSLIRPPYFVPESKKTAELFREMQKTKNHIAIILDEYGGTAGIVTIEDLIEEIVGNISDEYDEDEESINEIEDNVFEIDGLMSINDVEDRLEAHLPVEDYDTLSGFILGQLGRFPEEDEVVQIPYHGFMFEIIEIENKIITKVRVTKIDEEHLEEDEKEDHK